MVQLSMTISRSSTSTTSSRLTGASVGRTVGRMAETSADQPSGPTGNILISRTLPRCIQYTTEPPGLNSIAGLPILDNQSAIVTSHSTDSKTHSALKFAGPDAFQRWLKARVERYFQMTGRPQRGAISVYVKALVLVSWFALSYVGLVFFAATWWQGILLAISLGAAISGIGFSVMHDGGHNAFSPHRWLNRLAAMSLDILGGSSYIWDHKHNTVHHTYANIADHDDDINLGVLARLAPSQRRLWFHRVQHFYLWVLYGFLPMKWHLVSDFVNVARGKIATHRFARPRGWNLATFIGGKLVFLTLAFVIPTFWHPFWEVFLFYALVCWVNGIVISVVFQLAHAVEQAEFPLPDQDTGRMPTPWAVHQVQTTVDFARGNPVLTWFLGGLNYQIEHHLFPRISHVHYPRLSRFVQHGCRRYNLPYNEHPNMFAAIASHYRWLRRMGQPV